MEDLLPTRRPVAAPCAARGARAAVVAVSGRPTRRGGAELGAGQPRGHGEVTTRHTPCHGGAKWGKIDAPSAGPSGDPVAEWDDGRKHSARQARRRGPAPHQPPGRAAQPRGRAPALAARRLPRLTHRGHRDRGSARRLDELGDRGQARCRAHRDHRAARRGTPAARGRARRRQDDAGQDAGQVDRRVGATGPVHPRPAAERHHRGQRLQPGRARLRVPAGRDLRQRRRRRRDQPCLAEDAVRAAGVDGGGPGHGRRPDLRPAEAVHRDGHPEPHRDGGHLPAARGAARPVHGPHLARLPLGPRRGRHARHAMARSPRSRP